MHIFTSLSIVSIITSVQALSAPSDNLNLFKGSWIRRGLSALSSRTDCPAVWNEISQELTAMFLSGGQCTDDARTAIRSSFHDCFPGNGCDGSLFLAQEYTRPENVGMTSFIQRIGQMAQDKNVGVADLFQFAGAHAIRTCPMGPTIRAWVGRTDSSTPAPEGQLPSPFSDGDTILQMFTAKGFSARELAALIGAHTASKQFAVNQTLAGASQDTTPGVWDVRYYGETLDKTAPFSFQSDLSLSTHQTVGPEFKSFVDQQAAWNAAFAPAMEKLSLLGVQGGSASLIDCTCALPAGTARRDMRNAPINARV